MTTNEDERLQTELSLLEAMYNEQIHHNAKAREISYKAENASFTLRLPDGYLVSALPEVLAASIEKQDVREHLKKRVSDCSVGEESLDAIVLAFSEMVESHVQHDAHQQSELDDKSVTPPSESKATVIIWLHHLLNTNKRKMALSPPSKAVSGLTKPGYPGVLVFSGPDRAVHEHVNELKQQNWQAFQVRLETEDQWEYSHGGGVKEVEAMKDVVADIMGEENQALFMEAMRMK